MRFRREEIQGRRERGEIRHEGRILQADAPLVIMQKARRLLGRLDAGGLGENALGFSGKLACRSQLQVHLVRLGATVRQIVFTSLGVDGSRLNKSVSL